MHRPFGKWHARRWKNGKQIIALVLITSHANTDTCIDARTWKRHPKDTYCIKTNDLDADRQGPSLRNLMWKIACFLKMISLAGASFIIIASPWKRSMESCLKASERILKQFFVSSTISISMVENIIGQGSKQGDRKITECSNRPRARRQRSVANYPIPNATSRRGRSDARWHRKRSSLQSSCIYINI